MNSEYIELEAIKQLELSADFDEQRAGELLAKRFERLVKRQGSELAQLTALRRDLRRLPPGPRRAVAEGIADQVRTNNGRALRIADKMLDDIPRRK